MKITSKPKVNKDKKKKKPIVKPKKEHVLIVAQEIKFARLLSSNEKKIRDRVLKSLKKWLLNCFVKGYKFKEDDFIRVWKGLFYAVWMSDKPLIQEELCESIAAILDLFPADQVNHAMLMMKAGFRVLATEWFGIDQHRMDKFLMLVRRYLRGALRCLHRCEWNVKACKAFTNALLCSDGILCVKTPVYARNSTSMLLHIMDCFLEEVSKVSEGNIPPPSVAELWRIACSHTCNGEVATLCVAARRALTALLRQSELGLVYRDKTEAWKQMGCPRGGPDALELASDDDDDSDDERAHDDEDSDSTEKPLDPRAGRVDVMLSPLPVPSDLLANMLRDMIGKTSSKAHKRARICLQRFEQLAREEYPLKVEEPEVEPPGESLRVRANKSANMLHKLEKRLIANSDELALRGLSRKHRKRVVARARAGLPVLDTATSDWNVEETEPKKKKLKQSDDTDKENLIKKKKKPNIQTEKQVKKQPDKQTKEKKDKKNKTVLKDKKKNGEMKVSDAKVKVKVDSEVKSVKSDKCIENKKSKKTVVVNKVKHFQKSPKSDENPKVSETPKKVKFVLKNNSMQGTVDYYKSVRSSPNIPYDGTKKPSKTNLKVSTPSPINPFFKKKLRLK